MRPIAKILRDATRRLDDRAIPYTICGSSAVFFRSFPRPWSDIVLELSGQNFSRAGIEKTPGGGASETIGSYRVLSLEPLVRMKLARYSLNDRVDLRDLVDVELVDGSWLARFPDELAARLQHLIDTPDG